MQAILTHLLKTCPMSTSPLPSSRACVDADNVSRVCLQVNKACTKNVYGSVQEGEGRCRSRCMRCHPLSVRKQPRNMPASFRHAVRLTEKCCAIWANSRNSSMADNSNMTQVAAICPASTWTLCLYACLACCTGPEVCVQDEMQATSY